LDFDTIPLVGGGGGNTGRDVVPVDVASDVVGGYICLLENLIICIGE